MKKLLSFLLMIIVSTSLQAAKKPAVKIAAYLETAMVEKAQLVEKMSSKNFRLLAEHDVNGNPEQHVYVFTQDKLIELSQENDRAFAATLRVLSDSKNNKTVFANPSYFQRAFLQKDYNNHKESIESLSAALMEIFPDLQETKDKLKEKELKKYHFMISMPYYDDFITIAKGKDLYNKFKAKAADRISFDVELKSGHLLAINLNEHEDFVNKIEVTEKSNLLPYPIYITDEKAIIMHPKYYLALSFPLLSMGQFMKISSVPGNIEDEFKDIFK